MEIVKEMLVPETYPYADFCVHEKNFRYIIRRGFVHFVLKSLRAMRQCLHLRGRSERFDPLGEAVTEVRDEVTRSRI